MLTSLDHVTIAVRDVEAATLSYQRLLGVPPIWRGSHPEARTEASLFALVNSVVELGGPARDAVDAEETEGLRTLLDTRGEGLTTLSFGADDAAGATKSLRERGVRATPPQDGTAVGSDGNERHYQLVELSPRATRSLAVSIVARPSPLVAQRQVEPASGLLHALDHVVVRSADLEAALALYGTALGIRLALDTHFAGTRMLFFRVGGVTLEVVEDPSVGASDVLSGVAYRTHDLAAAHARLSAEGFSLSELRRGHKPGTEVFTVRDQTHGVPTLVLHDPTRDRSA